MYKVEILPSDIKEQQIIERRRRAEEERKARIFAPKTRQLGVGSFLRHIPAIFILILMTLIGDSCFPSHLTVV